MNIIRLQSENHAWDEFVSSAPHATAYHQYGWKTVFEQSFGHQGHYLAAVDDAGRFLGVLPLVQMSSRLFGNFLVSVPFVNYGGVLYASAEAAASLLAEAENVRSCCKADYVELRHVGHGMDNLPTKQHKVTMILPLAADPDVQWSTFNTKLRNQIRKAGKNGLQTAIGHLELLDDFYDVFARNMRDLGTPVYGKQFFRNLLGEFAASTRIITVTSRGKTIAAGIALWFRDTLEVPWASSVADYKTLCPNNLLYWEAIRFAISNGFEKFDFGRSTPGEGTYNYKKQWGAEPVPLSWQYLLAPGKPLPELNLKNPKYELAIKIWQKLPLRLTRILGPPIVRNIP